MLLDLLACPFDIFARAVRRATRAHAHKQCGRRKRNQDYSFYHTLSFVQFGCLAFFLD
jgi:hypothetical protein